MVKSKYLIGIDEAGRGPLAGPVAVGTVSCRLNDYHLVQKIFSKIKDCKKLSLNLRETWYWRLKEARRAGLINFACAYSSNLLIDKRGIVWGIKSALACALRQLENNRPRGSIKNVKHLVFNISPKNSRVLLDGSLKAPAEYENQQTIIRGDDTEMIIAMASVVAKVRRDRLIKRLAKKYSGYGFEEHVGYGTAAHYRALAKLGLSPIHRRSFLSRWLRPGKR
jgi:ribonuclease HII